MKHTRRRAEEKFTRSGTGAGGGARRQVNNNTGLEWRRAHGNAGGRTDGVAGLDELELELDWTGPKEACAGSMAGQSRLVNITNLANNAGRRADESTSANGENTVHSTPYQRMREVILSRLRGVGTQEISTVGGKNKNYIDKVHGNDKH
ncbi:unnamed protein product [Phytophthora lilii]|uniref:Unnamed protein product n=1 Tax=Phytophthora lilii TaxID=2077276 RepID=A0A9W6YKU6_9STRA|nr:unnamed protein product [Phytophthora lilii]